MPLIVKQIGAVSVVVPPPGYCVQDFACKILLVTTSGVGELKPNDISKQALLFWVLEQEYLQIVL